MNGYLEGISSKIFLDSARPVELEICRFAYGRNAVAEV